MLLVTAQVQVGLILTDQSESPASKNFCEVKTEWTPHLKLEAIPNPQRVENWLL